MINKFTLNTYHQGVLRGGGGGGCDTFIKSVGKILLLWAKKGRKERKGRGRGKREEEGKEKKGGKIKARGKRKGKKREKREKEERGKKEEGEEDKEMGEGCCRPNMLSSPKPK